MSRKAEYEWGCRDSNPDGCVLPFETEVEARIHTRQCGGVLMVRRADRDRDWEEASCD